MSQSLLRRGLRLPSWFLELISVFQDNALDATNSLSSRDDVTLSPLEIDLVLRQILSYLPAKSVLRCRLVSRSWNDAALHCLRQEQGRQIYILTRISAFARMCTELQNCPLIALARFELYWLDLLNEQNFKCCVKFFAQHSPDINHLVIFDQLKLGWVKRMLYVMHDVPALERVGRIFNSNSNIESMARMNLNKVQRVLGQTPNLKRLSLFLYNSSPILNPSLEMNTEEEFPFRFPQLEMLAIYLQVTRASSREFLEKVFAVAPKLLVLVIWAWAAYQYQEGAVMEAMEKLQLRAVLFLHNIAAGLGIPIYRAVASTQKLKSLGISLNSGVFQTWEVVDAHQDLLESQAEHLDTLFLLNGYYTTKDKNENVPKLRLPVMKKITRASLSFFQFSKNLDPKKVPFNMHPLTPEQVPSLRTLNLYTPYLSLGVIADFPFWTVTQLLFQNEEQEYYPGVLLQVAARFPNLKKLHNLCILNISSSDVALMVSSWPDMEDLFLTLRSDRPQTDFNLVLSGVVAHGGCESNENLGNGSLDAGPSLVHLKNLKKCGLNFIAGESDNWLKKLVGSDKWFHLDETAVYQTFLRMSPQLRLYLTGDFSISDDLRAVLLAHYLGRINLTKQRARVDIFNVDDLVDDFMKSSKQ